MIRLATLVATLLMVGCSSEGGVKAAESLCREEIKRAHGGGAELRDFASINRDQLQSQFVDLLRDKARSEGKSDSSIEEQVEIRKGELDQLLTQLPAEAKIHSVRLDRSNNGAQQDICVVENNSCSCLGDF